MTIIIIITIFSFFIISLYTAVVIVVPTYLPLLSDFNPSTIDSETLNTIHPVSIKTRSRIYTMMTPNDELVGAQYTHREGTYVIVF